MHKNLCSPDLELAHFYQQIIYLLRNVVLGQTKLFAKSEVFTMSYSQEEKELECQKDLSYFFRNGNSDRAHKQKP